MTPPPTDPVKVLLEACDGRPPTITITSHGLRLARALRITVEALAKNEQAFRTHGCYCEGFWVEADGFLHSTGCEHAGTEFALARAAEEVAK